MRPESETELAEMIRAAGGPVSVRGGGTRVAWRPVPGDVLETGGLSRIGLYEPGALTLVAGAGTPVETVADVLAERGQRLAFEPPDMRALTGAAGQSTIGGVMAANAGGPRRVQVGAARDFLLGVRFVDGTGQVIANGGRVMKNVTGYDLVKLIAGSHGTLGVLSEVSLKVMAIPQAEATLVAEGLETEAALSVLRAALGTPYDVSGAAHVAAGGASRTMIRLEGLSGSVDYRAGRLGEGPCAGWRRIDAAESAAAWREVRDVLPFAGTEEAVWKVSARPSDGAAVARAAAEAGIDARAIHDWGGGLTWLAVPPGDDAAAGVVRGAVARLGGHATLVRAPDAVRARVPMFQPEPAGIRRLSDGLRARFDPRGLLNPGLMGADAAVPA
ncbi:MAG: FAD-binding protein [Pseudooceanicola sp.]